MTSTEPPSYFGTAGAATQPRRTLTMARTSILSTETPDIIAINLNLLLSRLERSILSPEADPKLRHSSYERTRVGANLEYARTLLLRLEHSTSTIKIQSRKQAAQNNLLAQRALIKRLNERLYELEQLDDDAEDDDGIEEEDLLGEADDALPSEPPSSEQQRDPTASDQRAEAPGPLEPSQPSTLRSQHPPPATAAPDTAHTTATATSTSTSLFPHPTTAAQTRTTETLLSHNTHEQESLTTSLLALAQALKSSSQSFAGALEDEKAILNRAGEGLDKSGAGMEAAEKRMGALRRMSEGRGLWGRLLMYVWIAGLMVVALVVVFVLPKLRF